MSSGVSFARKMWPVYVPIHGEDGGHYAQYFREQWVDRIAACKAWLGDRYLLAKPCVRRG
jgi:hypothetical protein